MGILDHISLIYYPPWQLVCFLVVTTILIDELCYFDYLQYKEHLFVHFSQTSDLYHPVRIAGGEYRISGRFDIISHTLPM